MFFTFFYHVILQFICKLYVNKEIHGKMQVSKKTLNAMSYGHSCTHFANTQCYGNAKCRGP